MTGLDLAVIGNCTVASVISPAGRHVWFCFPRLDADPVFNALLGGREPDAGYLETVLQGQTGAAQSYLPNTAVLETILTDRDGGKARVVDFCPLFRRDGRMVRPPMLVRRIERLAGQPRISVALRPRFRYGASVPSVRHGGNHLRYLGPDRALRVNTDVPLPHLMGETEFVLDHPLTLIIGTDEPVTEAPESLGRRLLDATASYWRDWAGELNVPPEWHEAVIRAAITLELCRYDDTGAIVAALTTSIPESPGSGRNWDYRYCWLRDAYFTVGALERLGAPGALDGFLRFAFGTVHCAEGTDIAPLYPIAPGTDLEERIAGALPGFLGDGPVRIGNAAHRQRQNDAYGSIIMSAAPRLRGDIALYHRLRPLGEAALRLALVPDAGPWESRGRVRVHSYSAAMCWAAAHKLGLIARRVGAEEEAARWLARADELGACIRRRSVAATGGWISGALDEAVVDASVLLLPRLGLVPPADPGFVATLDLVKQRLLRNGFVMRYAEADDFGEPRTAFLACTFWYIEALAGAGRRDEALALFQNVLAHRNHVGLLSEDIAPADGTLWGNFPQTYSQAGVIIAATRLSRLWKE